MERDNNLQQLAAREFDILVVGGGITGACIAHDAALRGFSVALIERGDFGSFTSSASSKLLHGGIRYLPKGQIWKVRESGREQMIFQQLAPHLTSWIPFLIPTRKGSLTKGALALKTAMYIYRLCHLGLSNLLDDRTRKPATGQFYSASATVSLAPRLANLEGLTGSQVLYESHMHSSERMTLAFLKTAVHNRAVIANYLEAKDYLVEQSRVQGVLAHDRLTGNDYTISARLTINSAGPAVQALNRSVPALGLGLKKELTGFSRGVHLVTRQIHPKYALALTTRKKTEGFITRGGRHFFIIPWRGCSLIGTTNVPFSGNFDALRVTGQDVDDFLADINGTLPDIGLTRSDVHYAFTGLYPLIARDIQSDKYQGTGEYQIVDHQARQRVAGVITALGAKFTTARNVAEKVVNLAAKKLTLPVAACATHASPLLEGRINDLTRFISEKQRQYSDVLSADAVAHLIRYHGAELDQVMAMAADTPDLLKPLSAAATTLAVEVLYGVRAEMAMTLDDVIFRRTGAGTKGQPDQEALQRAGDIMTAELGWSKAQLEEEKCRVLARYSYGQK
ncbi:MAG TPA: glycerol-3-phosphate dehydrogenase/oxidase [Desulfobacterales bacterium]|nr:glycerol-3-phosphate dehydrogenase/oxidase [Desulfobacterales bacterium]